MANYTLNEIVWVKDNLTWWPAKVIQIFYIISDKLNY